jgi:hypothetical protein
MRETFLKTLKRMTCSCDTDCRDLAVKCLMLVSSQESNLQALVQSNVIEALYNALSVATEGRTKWKALRGIRNLSDSADNKRSLLKHIKEQGQMESPEFAVRTIILVLIQRASRSK